MVAVPSLLLIFAKHVMDLICLLSTLLSSLFWRELHYTPTDLFLCWKEEYERRGRISIAWVRHLVVFGRSFELRLVPGLYFLSHDTMEVKNEEIPCTAERTRKLSLL